VLAANSQPLLTPLPLLRTRGVVAHGGLLEEAVELQHLVVVGAGDRLDALRGRVKVLLL
jgi:hypothetical protein